MAMAKSIKMYLTIFVATTCIYMVLYQYHIARQPMLSAEVIKKTAISAVSTSGGDTKATTITTITATALRNAQISKRSSSPPSSAALLMKKYNRFLWSPFSLLAATQATTTADPPLSLSQYRNVLKSSDILPPTLISASVSSLQSPTSLNTITRNHNNNSNNNKNSVAHRSLVPQISHSVDSNNDNNHFIQIPSNNVTNINHTTTTTTTTTAVRTTSTNTRTANAAGMTSSANATALTSSSLSSSRFIATRTNTSTPATATTSSTTNAALIRKRFVAGVDPPPLYIITPTYRRPEQLAELTRMGYTLKHMVNLLWLVIEDANKTSELVTQTLNRIGVPYEYLVAPMPELYKLGKKAKPRGVSNRNRGLEWLRQNASDGVFYFADDDNTYDINIFEQMRYTKKVSMWPVGLVTKFGVSSPIIRKGKIDGFYDGWIGGRKFPVDMAGFAVSVKFLQERPAATMPYKPGYEEDGFLKSLAPFNVTEIELLASNCTEILTWHTQTKKNQPAAPLNMTKYKDTNLLFIDKLQVRP